MTSDQSWCLGKLAPVYQSFLEKTYAGGLKMTSKIKEQILAIRDTGETNMFDVRKVQEIALREGYNELLVYLADNVGAYSRFILTGKEE